MKSFDKTVREFAFSNNPNMNKVEQFAQLQKYEVRLMGYKTNSKTNHMFMETKVGTSKNQT